jgi:hypothetical protein
MTSARQSFTFLRQLAILNGKSESFATYAASPQLWMHRFDAKPHEFAQHLHDFY